ncbi:mannan endo-1,6-alpha-mannosidase [Wilcoxina mikolae CBS 423.85]|nr:mannan endo-1,6-alpha-mannosidase [Wilcoxina mikolae CBS 423.85]
MKLPLLLQLLALASIAFAIDINIDDKISIKNAAARMAQKLRALYPTGEPWFNPGEFGLIPSTTGKNIGYYWWEGGAAMGAWIEYWAATGDTQYNGIVTEALLHQVGPDNDYQPPNQTLSLGNDDQAFWAIAVLAAAERGYPDPPKDKPQWLALAQAVFNRQVSRWDDKTCGGGLRWQAVATNQGYDYKNSVSNGLLFQMGARLARYTGNRTYSDWGFKAYDWSKKSGLLTDKYTVLDGLHLPDCQVSSKIMWSYNAGIYMAGAAAMYDYETSNKNTSGAAFWQKETTALLQATDEPFFNRADGHPNVMRESACEARAPKFDTTPTCNIDQRSFKAYLSRFMAYTYQLCPFTRDYIMARLRPSAVAAAQCCNGQPDGDTCGLSWIMGKYDGSTYGIARGGVGEHMATMELFQSLLIADVVTPKTYLTGTSKGDPSAGTGGGGLSADALRQTKPTTTGDKAGAAILTALFSGAVFTLTWWLVWT